MAAEAERVARGAGVDREPLGAVGVVGRRLRSLQLTTAVRERELARGDQVVDVEVEVLDVDEDVLDDDVPGVVVVVELVLDDELVVVELVLDDELVDVELVVVVVVGGVCTNRSTRALTGDSRPWAYW